MPIICKAQKVRTLIKRDFDQAFDEVDVILTPTTPAPAFALGEKSGDPVEMYLNDIFTVTVNMAGLPGMSVPAGLRRKERRSGCSSSASRSTRRPCSGTARAIEQAAGPLAKPQDWWSKAA